MTDRPCKYIGDTEGSLKAPMIIKDQDFLANLTPVDLIRIDTVKATSQYDSSKKYDAQEFTFYSYTAQKYYRIRLKKDLKNLILAAREINPDVQKFTTEKDSNSKTIWIAALE